MRRFLALLVAPLLVWTSGCEHRVQRDYKSVIFLVHNPTGHQRTDEAVHLELGAIVAKAPDFDPLAFRAVCEGREVPSQANDLDGDGKIDQLVLLLDLPPRSTKKIALRYGPSQAGQPSHGQRAHAELSVKTGGQFVDKKYVGGHWTKVQRLRVPKEHTDHSEFIRYEGPGWESDRVGYRFYLDWRNAIDVFGKKVPQMVLQDVGLDGFESYHQMADWGMDILKVGESLGVGSVGMWVDGKAQRVSLTDSVMCEIVLDGPVESLVRTTYWGWRVGENSCDLVSELSITAGSRMTTHRLQIRGQTPNLCTGLVKDPNAQFLISKGQGSYGYAATYGRQSLAGDSLGLAIIYRQEDLIGLAQDEFSHVVVLQPKDGRLTYHFLAAWEQEPGGVKNCAEFIAHLDEMLERLEHPVLVE